MPPSSIEGKVRAKLGARQASNPSKRDIWQDFAGDHALIEAHNIKSEELEALERITMLGSVHSKADLIFMLSAIRRARHK